MTEVLVEATEVAATEVAKQVSVGERLREARERAGLTVEEVAATLKLGKRQVAGLENGDWAALPGTTFIRGFVRNYSRLLGLDSVELMGLLDSVLVRPVSNLDVPESKPVTVHYSSGFSVSPRNRQLLAGAGFIVILALAIYFLIPNDLSSLRGDLQSLIDSLAKKEQSTVAEQTSEKSAEPVFPPGSTPQQVMNPQVLVPAALPESAKTAVVATPSPGSQAVTAQPGVAQPQIRVVADRESWVEIRDRDARVIFSQRMQPGADQALSGQGPLSLVVGFAPGVRLFWRGQAVDLAPHSRGDVARLVLE